MTHLRLLACAALLALAALALPAGASASSTQLSVIQDDRELFGVSGANPEERMAEIRSLGADVVRTNVIFYKIFRQPSLRSRPANFVASDPDSSFYDWSQIDRLVNAAQANGIQILFTVTGPGPHFTSSSPSRCRSVPCSFRPRPSDFGDFTAAVAKRYAGRVDYYAIYNEPNIGKTWLSPRFQRTRSGQVDVAGAIYRKLFIAAYNSIARFDPARRNRVLFGEVAAIASPLPLLYAALCLDPKGTPFKGRLRALHGCSGRVAKLNIGGVAIHPYNGGAYGTPRSRLKNRPTALTLPYLPRLHRLMDRAARRGRIPRGRGIFITEFGFQTRPPDPNGISPSNQAQYINESDRLFFADRRVKSVAQYELVDVRATDEFNSGLRFSDGREKPSYAAYRLPLVVTRRSSGSVEVYGQARPARLSPGSSAQITIQANTGAGFRNVRTVFGNSRGIVRTNVSLGRASSALWRLVYQMPSGELVTSRTARAGAPLKYRRD